MIFLAYTHWRTALRKGSFVLANMEKNMNTKMMIAVIGASGRQLISTSQLFELSFILFVNHFENLLDSPLKTSLWKTF